MISHSTLVTAAALLFPSVSQALPRPEPSRPPLQTAVDVEERLGRSIPGDLAFFDERGQPVLLGQLLRSGRPVLLALAYFRCPMLCDMSLGGLAKTLARIGWEPGRDYQAITVSIDPKDEPSAARRKQAAILRAVGHPRAGAHWPFLTGPPKAIAQLADAVGFRYVYDPRSDQYAHPAVAVVLAPDGRIARYLYGVAHRPLDVRLALTEAAAGRVGGVVDRVLITCFRFDPSTRKYAFFMNTLFKGGSALVLLAVVSGLWALWRRDRARQREGVPRP